jgi:galactose mutarotase-like enzyme
MSFRVVSLNYGGRTYAVDAATESADVTRVRNQPSSKDRQKVIGGAIAGAIAGRISARTPRAR